MTIGLIGDSTVASTYGWGPAFAKKCSKNVTVLNYAKNGATLDSLSKKLDALLKRKPAYVLIQFGHNDMKRYDGKAYGAKLKDYVGRIKRAGSKAVVLSSVTRRTFDEQGKIKPAVMSGRTLAEFAKAAKAVADKAKVPFIDLNAISIKHHNKMGPEVVATYNFNEKDRTHFSKKGADVVAGLVIDELKAVVPELVSRLKTNDKPAVQKGESISVKKEIGNPTESRAFAQALSADWKETFSDDCTGDWKKQWFLDGEIGTVETGEDGMTLTAGPEFKNDAHHMVLWSKRSFQGDLKIEFDYTRLDTEKQCVTILYIQATGSGKGPYSKDISTWNDLRKVPSMSTYFNHMNAYHVSYAAFPNKGKDRTQYIRGRRYMPEKNGLKGTDMEPDYFPKGLFATGVTHHVTVIKRDRDLFMRIENPTQVYYCHLKNPKLPIITEGRIGLRHMFTRSATYKNVRIEVPADTSK